MAKYAFDTNVFIDANRSAEERDRLTGFMRQRLPNCYLSAVVGMELLAGIGIPAQGRAVEEELFAPFRRRGRLFGPSAEATLQAGRVLARAYPPAGGPPPRSFVNDVLIALSCRERGITVISHDRDFRRLTRFVPGLLVREPFPTGGP